MFVPAGWFAIDGANRRVAGVQPGSLVAGLALVGSGRVASVVGRLRAGVVAVDVDVDGQAGDRICAEIVGWAAVQGLWWLSRRSGGGAGRWHVLLVPGGHQPALEELLRAVRTAYGASGRTVDLRTTLRPLSAPHRSTGTVTVPRRLAAALRDLPAALEAAAAACPRPAGGGRKSVAATAAAATSRILATQLAEQRAGRLAPHVPLTRRRRPLPATWSVYLERGTMPVEVRTWQDGSDSAVLARLTYHLVVTGHNEADAWELISTSHPRACLPARIKGRPWWRTQVWDRVAGEADRWLVDRRTHHEPASGPGDGASSSGSRGDDPVTMAIEAARAALASTWLTWGLRERHTLRVVAEALLTRMERQQTLTVPCPERDLLLDTPVKDRKTIRTALRRLQDAAIGTLRSSFAPGGASPEQRSHTFVLHDRFTEATFSSPTHNLEGRGVRLDPPPWIYTPPPPVSLWRTLPLPARHTYAALDRSAPQTPSELAPAAGQVHGPGRAPTLAQVRTVRSYLQALAAIGLAQVDQDGRWTRSNAYASGPSTASRLGTERSTTRAGRGPGFLDGSLEVAEPAVSAGERLQQDVARRVADERALYRAGPAQASEWARTRDLAHARAAKAALVRQKAWWDGLDPNEQRRRREQRAAAYQVASVQDQHALKRRLADQRRAAGVVERFRHRRWVDAHTFEAFEITRIERAYWFDALPEPVQAALVRAWQAHRTSYDVPRGRHPGDPQLPAAAAVAQHDQHRPQGQHQCDQEVLMIDLGRQRESSRRLATAGPL